MHPFMLEIAACAQSAMEVGDLTAQQASDMLAHWHRYLIHPKKAKP